ncbi:UNVERIFIED_ORG: transcriptional regulator with XRE-family HTH domain [Mycolicibacterium obuense]
MQVHEALRHFREQADIELAAVAEALVLGAGWVEAWESGSQEPPLAMLSELLGMYGVSLVQFFDSVTLDETALAHERYLVVEATNSGLRLHFPMGHHRATVEWTGANADDANAVLATLRHGLAQPEPAKVQAVTAMFRQAVALWPHLNPSDIWTFFVSHGYQDQYNHPVSNAGTDLGQSWKRTGGWAFERILCEHYNPFLEEHGIWLEMPTGERKRELIESMNLPSSEETNMEKADVLVVGRLANGTEYCFGVVHAKASIAERRTDDVPLSRTLLERGFASPLVTMDCKSSPSAEPFNRGEYGPAQGGPGRVSAKRLDVERDKAFGAVFSYNRNTIPTPGGTPAAARISVIDFQDPDDPFARHLVDAWQARQGLK